MPVGEDESNISEIVKKRDIDPKLGEDLKKANGMRNIIVHRYNEIEEDIILNSVEEVKTLLMNWLDIIEELLEEIGGA
ncbi:MAG: HepT-like ribonuclease domain-containing protein [Promethearchaeota archaeon]